LPAQAKAEEWEIRHGSLFCPLPAQAKAGEQLKGRNIIEE